MDFQKKIIINLWVDALSSQTDQRITTVQCTVYMYMYIQYIMNI